AIVAVNDRREITDARHLPPRRWRNPQERNHVVVYVAPVDPPKPLRVRVAFEERRLASIQAIELSHETSHPFVLGLLQQVPIEARVVVPLVRLPELAPHEEQLLPGMSPHVSVERAQVRELSPAISGHLPQERAFAVNDLVVGQREDEI